jgi:hypothetical protein
MTKPNGAINVPKVCPNQAQVIAKNVNPASQPFQKALIGLRPYHVAKSPAAPSGAKIDRFVVGNARAIAIALRTATRDGKNVSL